MNVTVGICPTVRPVWEEFRHRHVLWRAFYDRRSRAIPSYEDNCCLPLTMARCAASLADVSLPKAYPTVPQCVFSGHTHTSGMYARLSGLVGGPAVVETSLRTRSCNR